MTNGSNRRPEADGRSEPPHGLRRWEALLTLVVFGLWLVAFTGGIVIDTKPSRCLISPQGVAALEQQRGEAATNAAAACSEAAVGTPTAAGAPTGENRRLSEREERWSNFLGWAQAWAIVLLWFLPVNLALLCMCAGTLGALGNRANLHTDSGNPNAAVLLDTSSPYLSALLRGFFVYLVMISGLLLLDDDPFASPSPGQYIRLAGFLSLFSFVVSYNPHVFATLVSWAATRIGDRQGAPRPGAQAQQVVQATINEDGKPTLTVGQVATTGPAAVAGGRGEGAEVERIAGGDGAAVEERARPAGL